MKSNPADRGFGARASANIRNEPRRSKLSRYQKPLAAAASGASLSDSVFCDLCTERGHGSSGRDAPFCEIRNFRFRAPSLAWSGARDSVSGCGRKITDRPARKAQGVVNFNAQVPHGALQLSVTQQELAGPQIAGLLV